MSVPSWRRHLVSWGSRLLRALEQPEPSPTLPAIDVFISHSHSETDRLLAEELVCCLVDTMDISHEHIRCTSLNGYGLPPGERFDAALRDDLASARAVIGILTPKALASGWVVMELGAAWGLRRRTYPLLTETVPPESVPGPLVGTCTSSASRPNDVVGLLEAVAEATGRPLRHDRLTRSALRFVQRVH